MAPGRVGRRGFARCLTGTFAGETISDVRMLAEKLLVFLRVYPDRPGWLRFGMDLLSGAGQLMKRASDGVVVLRTQNGCFVVGSYSRIQPSGKGSFS